MLMAPTGVLEELQRPPPGSGFAPLTALQLKEFGDWASTSSAYEICAAWEADTSSSKVPLIDRVRAVCPALAPPTAAPAMLPSILISPASVFTSQLEASLLGTALRPFLPLLKLLCVFQHFFSLCTTIICDSGSSF